MLALRYAIVLSALLALTGVPPAAAQAGKTAPPSFRSSFEKSFLAGFSKECLQSVKEASAGRIREESLVSFCDCSVNGTFKELTTTDLLKLFLAGKIPDAADAKMDKVMEACWNEHVYDKSASR
jgi:hypothetical protein